jgi:hypothetical protein
VKPGLIDWPTRRTDLAEAEKDIPFALVALQEGNLPKATLNLAIAFVRIVKHQSDSDWRALFEGLEGLKKRVAAKHQAGPKPAEGDQGT